MLLKFAIWAGGVLMVGLAFIGVAFFGWDVRKARNELIGAQKEIRDNLEGLRKDFKELKELKENLEQLGAQLEEDGELNSGERRSPESSSRNNIDLIREVINSGSYEWTTIGRILKRTGLSRENVLEEIRGANDIKIGKGKKTQDFIFKFKYSNR